MVCQKKLFYSCTAPRVLKRQSKLDRTFISNFHFVARPSDSRYNSPTIKILFKLLSFIRFLDFGSSSLDFGAGVASAQPLSSSSAFGKLLKSTRILCRFPYPAHSMKELSFHPAADVFPSRRMYIDKSANPSTIKPPSSLDFSATAAAVRLDKSRAAI